jgi:hypothetical protein
MLVPIYLEMPDGRQARLGTMPISGSTTKDFSVNLGYRPKSALLNAHEDLLAQNVEAVAVK